MRFRALVFCVLSLALPVVAFAAANAPGLMTIDFGSRSGVGEVEVLSYSWGVSNAGSMGNGSGGGEGKASFHDLSFTHKIDKASPVLFQSATGHIHFPEVSFRVNAQFADGSVRPVVKLTLSDVLISSYTQSGDGGLPVETISLNYQNITFAFASPAP